MGDGAKLIGKRGENKRSIFMRQQRLERTLVATRRTRPAKTPPNQRQLRGAV